MVPVRTCVACRKRAPRTELLRVVVHEDRLVVRDKLRREADKKQEQENPEAVKAPAVCLELVKPALCDG
jgi:hypothetical protein